MSEVSVEHKPSNALVSDNRILSLELVFPPILAFLSMIMSPRPNLFFLNDHRFVFSFFSILLLLRSIIITKKKRKKTRHLRFPIDFIILLLIVLL